MATHNFSFAGGEILTKMGATWFVSYAYYDHCDRSHKNWEKVKTWSGRVRYYERSRKYHKEWLKQVLAMNDANLVKNTIGLSPYETKKMARELLAKGF